MADFGQSLLTWVRRTEQDARQRNAGPAAGRPGNVRRLQQPVPAGHPWAGSAAEAGRGHDLDRLNHVVEKESPVWWFSKEEERTFGQGLKVKEWMLFTRCERREKKQ
ncbi:hypothetical protein [Pseudodesulfovibrio sp.]|uniref:hypothetical protein n=1 Tax=Pseudodesulfovibrio sp. TaxID=2035812 RepID=UPI00262B22EE|nr:hypothetical protein [Pseudodesulfovibrio sp.]MDD3313440.1 hypothetical protein [Pseudodesulfovibrio sp.]